MNSELKKQAEHIIEIMSRLPMVKSCELCGSISNGSTDELSDIDIEVDVSGYDNGKFMLEIPELLKNDINIIFYDFASSLMPEQYIISLAVNDQNPFAMIDVKCVAAPHVSFVSKGEAVNDILHHTIKVWVINLKHYVRGADCYDDIVRMAQRIQTENIETKEIAELLEEVLIWMEKNQTDAVGEYIRTCRKKFQELVS